MGNTLSYAAWNDEEVKKLENSFKDSLDVLKWAFHEYGNDIVYACSFGIEGIVLIDLIYKVKRDAHILFLDTGLHFQETYKLIDKVQQRYPELKIEMLKPELTLSQQADVHGEELWKTEPNRCCYLRKVEPLENALSRYPAWISGIRREQSKSRQQTNYINKDEKFQSIKVCPLIYWKIDEIWMYVKLHQLDYNVLHDQGYPSIGCAVCTLPASDPNDPRSGRWTNFDKTECGIHTF